MVFFNKKDAYSFPSYCCSSDWFVAGYSKDQGLDGSTGSAGPREFRFLGLLFCTSLSKNGVLVQIVVQYGGWDLVNMLPK
jgi:hypothetical protein